MPGQVRQEISVEGRHLSVSNLDKVMWPSTGFTKGQMIDYYVRVAPFLLPHIEGRALTLRRWPNGVDKASFFEKNCPSHRPDWLQTVEMGGVGYCDLTETAALAWTANLAAVELHPTLWSGGDVEHPRSVVFDLDPGPGTDILTCGRLAFLLKEALEHLGLDCWPKTSGSKGLQLYVPVAPVYDFATTRNFSLALAQVMERAHPDLVVTTQDRSKRTDRVLIDWSQNSSFKTTVAVYSLRAKETPEVSTPVSWEELDNAITADDPSGLRFSPEAVLARVGDLGDLMAPLLDSSQELPALG